MLRGLLTTPSPPTGSSMADLVLPMEHTPCPRTDNEDARLSYLHSLSILDTVPDPAIDNIVEFLARLFKVPIALVSILDSERQWFKARTGLEASETPRDWSFC